MFTATSLPAVEMIARVYTCRPERPPAASVLQALPGLEAGACTPLLRQREVHPQDGPLLHLGGELCGAAELQGEANHMQGSTFHLWGF